MARFGKARGGRGRRGFTLVEILSAMAVLLILVMLVGRMFHSATSAWTLGTRRAQDNLMARAAMDLIARDLASAIADTNIGFRLSSYHTLVFGPGSNPWWNDALFFVSLANEPGSDAPRAAREVVYYVTNMVEVVGNQTNSVPGRYRLMRATKTDAITCYQKEQWWRDWGGGPGQSWGKREVLVENIGSFEVWCYGATSAPNGSCTFKNVPSYNSPSDPDLMRKPDGQEPENIYRPFQKGKLPAWVEIFLSVLEEDAAIKAKALYDAGRYDACRDYVERNARRYAMRVYLPNREGYAREP